MRGRDPTRTSSRCTVRPPSELPESGVIVLRSPGRNGGTLGEHYFRTLASWPEGEALSGTITMEHASGSLGYSTRVIASGTPFWRATTIELSASVTRAC
jgi:hypothetical protein